MGTPLQEFAMDRFDAISKSKFQDNSVASLQATFRGAKSFGAGIVGILRDVGVDESHLHGLTGEKVGANDWMDAFRGIMEDVENYTVDTVIGGAVTFMTGSASAGGWAVDWWEKRREMWADQKVKKAKGQVAAMRPGMWVYINNGLKPGMAPVGQEPGFKDEMRRRMMYEEDPVDDISIGFYIGLADRGRVKVFNFDVFHEEDVRFDDMVVVEASKANKLNENDVMRKIRDLRFAEKDSKKLDTDVATDPGSEVVFDGKRWHVVKAEGGTVLIEDWNGARNVVSLDKLQTGRKTHTNSWNYQEGKPFQSGFKADGAAELYAGRWVWVIARETLLESETTTHELACVWYIDGEGLHVIMAIDGIPHTVANYWLVHADLSETFNHNKDFVNFRDAAVRGYGTDRYRLGYAHLLICLGIADGIQIGKLSGEGKLDSVVPVVTQKEDIVGAGNTKDIIDATEEFAELVGVPVGAISMEAPEPVDNGSGSNSLWGFAAVVGGAAFLLNSVGYL